MTKVKQEADAMQLSATGKRSLSEVMQDADAMQLSATGKRSLSKVKQEADDMQLSATGKRSFNEVMQESLIIKQELEQSNDLKETRRKRKLSESFLNAFESNEAKAPTLEKYSDDVEEKQKESIQKEAAARNKIAALENKMSDDKIRIDDLEKRYKDLEKEKGVLAGKDDARKKENECLLMKISILEKSLDEHKKDTENILEENNALKGLVEVSAFINNFIFILLITIFLLY